MNKKRKWGIGFKITSGYIILIICLIVSALVLNNQITSLQSERNGVIKYDSQMRMMSNNLERQILNMESSLQRYLITDDETHLDKFNEELATWEASYEELSTIVQDFSSGQEQLEVIHSGIEDWINNIGQPLLNAILANNNEEILSTFDGMQSSVAISDLQQKFTAFRTFETDAIQVKVAELNDQNTALTYSLFGILTLIATATIIIFTIISRNIAGSINEVTDAIQDMNASDGKVRKRITAKTNDEVKDLVLATNSLLTTLENRQWFQTNLAEVVTAYQGVDTLDELGEVLLNSLTTRTHSVYGAFYIQDIRNKNKFNKIAAFAETGDNVGRESFEVGQGFIGQSVKEKRILSYDNKDNSFHYLETALGNIPISNGIIVPVFFGQEVVAVFELASLKPYSQLHRDLIKEVVVHLGVTINSIIGRMEVIRLLNESQAMTEELQVQSEELQTQSEELKMQTEELTTINERLEERTRDAEQKTHELEKVQVELRQSAEQLRQSSNYKSEFLANMSHELRTPLNSILILSEMLAENHENHLSDDELEYAKVIHDSGEDLLNLINDILDLSKVEAGKMDLWFREMDVYEIPQHIQNLFMPIANQKGLELSVDVANDLAEIFHTDVKRFHQVLNNLLSNALKFTEEGSVTVKVDRARITPAMRQLSDTWITVSVTDTGIGIPKNKQNIVFESFQQADGATVRKYGGTGLGLSICREVTKLLGGWITLSSTEGQGSTFTVYLPSLPDGNAAQTNIAVQEAVYTDAAPAMGVSKSIFDEKHILIVDDDYRNIYALRQALEHKGVHILEASNGVECLNILQTATRVDAVLMDIMMPEMDGYETMERIRKDLQLHELPIIALTAKAMKQDQDRAFEAGASDYISKPLNLEQLFSVLTVWLTSGERLRNV
ncbi:Autoinducer 2 sensor kinase/phosphatase luxQ [Solibacillus isronensis B3W22]|uniref:Circadian input-output histidine kinase CikA n=2 Tax=Solibacillus TaxID=648800 RepID=F2F2E7_SOLSS|nr:MULTISPECIES: ATP-binding protein [Solibacillus]AMO86558.1 hybrid sensor histidine kinase/response regulator [Solibacillus silvestris]EKB45139.1 Autoinducer 2 sensor kinase/phosphatase luxQ [Solibacillus isronensis B3W22]BAK15399.1 signal transduction histidine kinase [Solibacillus silvestris StLB046]